MPWYGDIYFNHEDNQAENEDRENVEKMEIQEGEYQEALGGWTEVEMNAPREFQPKVT